ncbi:MAG: DUF2288 domain-containing protein [Nostocaceae cyanobacterium]|nr:DUF2288 domain-containing protein [Nostocaceae cyanobacterium]
MPDLRAELTENLDEAEWEWLIPHVQRDAVIVVSNDLDLLDVGVAIASDSTVEVQNWISEAFLTKPSVTQLGEWNTNPTKRFNTLIVQPYVLVQEKDAA